MVAIRVGTKILAGQGTELDEQALTQLNALGRVCQAVVQLRRSNQHAARQKIQTERWELEKEQIRADNSEAMQRKIRAALEARITSVMKMPEWTEKLGNTPDAARTAAILREIQICTDPAHFHSDVIGNPEWDRWVEKLKREAPPKKTEMQAALDTYREMEVGLGLRKDGDKVSRPLRRSKKHRRRRRPHTRPHTRGPRANKVHAVHDVHEVHEVAEVPTVPEAPPAPDPAATSDVASSLCPDFPDHSTTPPLQPTTDPAQSFLIVPNRA